MTDKNIFDGTLFVGPDPPIPKRIFVSSLFKLEKNYLGFYKFVNLSKLSKSKIIALGGINKKNLNRLSLLKISGYAGIGIFN